MTKRLFANINVKNIDVSLLREQRDDLLATIETMQLQEKQVENLDGIVNMLDVMLDIAEGKDVKGTPRPLKLSGRFDWTLRDN